MTTDNNTPEQRPQRQLKDMPHDFLVEKVQLLEGYVASMLHMIIQHHPYMGPAAQQIGQEYAARDAEVEARYPVSAIITPPSHLTIVKPH